MLHSLSIYRVGHCEAPEHGIFFSLFILLTFSYYSSSPHSFHIYRPEIHKSIIDTSPAPLTSINGKPAPLMKHSVQFCFSGMEQRMVWKMQSGSII